MASVSCEPSSLCQRFTSQEGVESLADGVYSITTTTRYNAAGQPITTVQKQLISQLSSTLESKSIHISDAA